LTSVTSAAAAKASSAQVPEPSETSSQYAAVEPTMPVMLSGGSAGCDAAWLGASPGVNHSSASVS
jgi:hypothetical protein